MMLHQEEDYSRISNRVASYNEWPYNETWSAKPATLAAAGFYFSPSELFHDRCVCFNCGVALASWEKSDIPAVEHKNHSPTCEFINSYLETMDTEVVASIDSKKVNNKKKVLKRDHSKCMLFHERENMKKKKANLDSMSVQKQEEIRKARTIRSAFLLKLLTGLIQTKKA